MIWSPGVPQPDIWFHSSWPGGRISRDALKRVPADAKTHYMTVSQRFRLHQGQRDGHDQECDGGTNDDGKNEIGDQP